MTHEIKLTVAFTPRTALFLLVVVLVAVVPVELGSETLIMSTTYPSPVGIYARLITTGGPVGGPGVNTILNRDNGKVGIGTATPGSALDVAGTTQLRGASGGTGLYVNSSGNVGIGTITPTNPLTVQGNANFNGSITSNGPLIMLPAVQAGDVLMDVNGTGVATWQPAGGASTPVTTSYVIGTNYTNNYGHMIYEYVGIVAADIGCCGSVNGVCQSMSSMLSGNNWGTLSWVVPPKATFGVWCVSGNANALNPPASGSSTTENAGNLKMWQELH